ncbi:MAG: hypothetical protein VX346_22640 [Planctomycetota bacterium]|nr:hypothetical protein [Planctomycetota bacterium]
MSRTRKACFALVATTLGLLLLEGLASVAVVANKMFTQRRLAERLHTEYDAQLGWINKTEFHGLDLYGTSLHLHTNAQRFRATEATAEKVPPGRVLVVCTGDSFTLGYGVADEDTWCAHLEQCDGTLQAVNLGQGGYGVDQAYLWYQRVESRYQHAIHLFAFITEDFRRMANDTFGGYGKPVLALDGDRLMVTNVPVPRTPYLLASLMHNGNLLAELNTPRVMRRVVWGKPYIKNAREVDVYSRRIAKQIFSELARQHAQRGRVFVLVHLPVKADLTQRSSAWRDFLARSAAESGWNYFYLGDEMARLPQDQVDALFLGNEVPYQAAAGHYSVRGNRFVATALHARLTAREDVRQLLKRAQQTETPLRSN